LNSFALETSLLTYKQQEKAETYERVTRPSEHRMDSESKDLAGWHNKHFMSHWVMEKHSTETFVKHCPIRAWQSSLVKLF